jgi:UPF0755 protein
MSESLDPKKYHILTPSAKKLILIVVGLFLFTAGPFIFYKYYQFAVNRPAQLGRDAVFEIRKGQGLNDIAYALHREGLVNSEFLFKLYVVLNRYDKNIQAGIYQIPAGTSVVRLVSILQHGTYDVTLTFLEGWRVEEYARLASQKLERIDYEKFVTAARPYEGYLFPDTYSVQHEIRESELIKLLRENFESKTTDILSQEALARADMNLEEAIIIASIVEREVNNDEDRALVAGILIRRWRDGHMLEADATTQYAIAPLKAGCAVNISSVCPSNSEALDMQWWPEILTREDLDYDSPYNTRKNGNLPPGPISNPGLDVIKAVLNYQESPYYYYLTDRDGVTHYSVTLNEHNDKVFRYLRSDQ